MNQNKRLWATMGVSCLFVGLSAAGVARAALSGASDARVSFQASAPAGMKIEGTTTELAVSDDGGNVVITVPLANLATGIGLRDRHMKEKYLEVQKYPNAVLTLARSALKVPAGGGQTSADAPGTLLLHGQARPVSVHYEARGDATALDVKGAFHINMNDYGITVPVYLGVTVKPDVDVTASFHVTGS